MAKTTQEKLEEAEQKAREAMHRVKSLKVERSQERRRADGHRKAILGGWLIANHPELVTKIVSSLKREQDVAAFSGWTLPSTCDRVK